MEPTPPALGGIFLTIAPVEKSQSNVPIYEEILAISGKKKKKKKALNALRQIAPRWAIGP